MPAASSEAQPGEKTSGASKPSRRARKLPWPGQDMSIVSPSTM
jgi:hypothetical protein